MGRDGLPDDLRRVHTRHGLGRETEARLAALGRQLPPPSEDEARVIAAERAAWRRRHFAARLVVFLLVVVVVGATVQWFRPLPEPALQGLATAAHIPGSSPALPWPSAGEAALSVQGLGTLASDGGTAPAPIGVLSGVLTAYVVLKDHPLPIGGVTGPSIAVSTEVSTAYRTGVAAGQPEVPVSAGGSLTELDALEGLLIDSGNDMATLLADWDAGSTSAFVTKMDLAAISLGLRNTHVTEPGGADGAVDSTPSDLIRLAESAMGIPVFQQIVSLGEVVLPGAGLRYNPNFVVGEDGVVGIEAGADTTGNGCYLFAAQKTVGGQSVTLYGAVLGQSGPNGPDTAAVHAGDALMKTALADLVTAPILQAGAVVGQLSAPWGASTPVTAAQAVTIAAWPGLTVPITVRPVAFSVPLAAGTRVGSLQLREGSRVVEVALHNTEPLRAPSGLWRFTR
jgi:serine-type D-Ala-D-Ala carboxypeptidase (penicillin-binding protein 5/6)